MTMSLIANNYASSSLLNPVRVAAIYDPVDFDEEVEAVKGICTEVNLTETYAGAVLYHRFREDLEASGFAVIDESISETEGDIVCAPQLAGIRLEALMDRSSEVLPTPTHGCTPLPYRIFSTESAVRTASSATLSTVPTRTRQPSDQPIMPPNAS